MFKNNFTDIYMFVLLIDNFSSIDLWVEIKKWNLYSDVVFF